MRDTSVDAATPALGFAARMISTCVLIFLSLVAFIFWLGTLAEHAVAKRGATHELPAGVPAGVPPGLPASAPGD